MTVYLLFLLFLTFFSDAVQEKSIPHVRCATVRSDYFEDRYYGKVIPLEAIIINPQEKYVFELVERDTPLGKRTYHNKIGISVIEIKGGAAAVSSVIQPGSRIAIDSNSLTLALLKLGEKNQWTFSTRPQHML